jgi:hypothetical protein
VELPAILSDEDMMPEIMRAYAERMRRSVKPDGGRQEGGATSLLDSLGVSLYNTLASPSRLVNSHMAEYQPGVSVQDMPETMKYLPEVATNVVGLPGVMGAVPEGAMGSAAGGKIKAYHGSPHDFDRFDMSKIGSGEGAQAYGHGLYFAENENVARQYRDALAGKSLRMADGTPIDPKKSVDVIRKSLLEAQPDFGQPTQAAQWIFNRLHAGKAPDAIERDIAGMAWNDSQKAAARHALRATDGWKTNPKMYEVNINAHPDQFLDWDKPIKGRPALEAISERSAKSFPHIKDNPDLTGQGLYQSFAGHRGGNPVAATEGLAEAGIPGIKYLDQGSRVFNPAGHARDLDIAEQLMAEAKRVGDPRLIADAESKIAAATAKLQPQQTSNYVLFDDSLIEILRKYGLAGLLGGGAASQMQEQPQQ